MATSSSSTLTQLQKIFPNVILVDSHDIATALGIAYKTLNNAGADFPIKSVRFGRRKYFRLIDIAAYVDGNLGIAPTDVDDLPSVRVVAEVPQPKRGRGRPSKQQNGVQHG